MKPAPFAYHDPGTTAEAVDLLGRLDNARPLAGGQSLVPMMNFRFVMPDHIVDLNGVAELAGVKEGATFSFGAMTRQRDVEFNAAVAEKLPVLREALLRVGHRQTRNRGTIGGSLCHLDPAAEMPAIMNLLDARLHIVGPRGRARDLPMSEFALGYMTTALESDELLARIDVSPWPEPNGFAWREFARRHGDFALASAGVMLALDAHGDIDRLALVIAGLGATSVRLLDFEAEARGAKPGAEFIAAAANAASSIEAMDDVHASAAYRQRLAGVMTTRALGAALERARERSAAHV